MARRAARPSPGAPPVREGQRRSLQRRRRRARPRRGSVGPPSEATTPLPGSSRSGAGRGRRGAGPPTPGPPRWPAEGACRPAQRAGRLLELDPRAGTCRRTRFRYSSPCAHVALLHGPTATRRCARRSESRGGWRRGPRSSRRPRAVGFSGTDAVGVDPPLSVVDAPASSLNNVPTTSTELEGTQVASSALHGEREPCAAAPPLRPVAMVHVAIGAPGHDHQEVASVDLPLDIEDLDASASCP